MHTSPRHHTARRLYRTIIALVQLLVMVMLAIPACCATEVSAEENPATFTTAGAVDGDHDACPCCPDENKSGSDSDTCSTCWNCNYYAPLIPAITTSYEPSITPLIIPEPFTKLTDVHIPIYVPPQNLA